MWAQLRASALCVEKQTQPWWGVEVWPARQGQGGEKQEARELSSQPGPDGQDCGREGEEGGGTLSDLQPGHTQGPGTELWGEGQAWRRGHGFDRAGTPVWQIHGSGLGREGHVFGSREQRTDIRGSTRLLFKP